MNPELIHVRSTAVAKLCLSQEVCVVDGFWVVDEEAGDVDTTEADSDDDDAAECAE